MKRILLKLTGEIFKGSQPDAVDEGVCFQMAHSIKGFTDAGLEVGIVIGGGNIIRGVHSEELGLQRTRADHMGMLATMINGVALQHVLETLGCRARVLTALECPKVAESYTWRRAREYLSDGQILIFVGGTGNPYFSTDSAAALRASELEVDLLLKATKVDGVYDKDPVKYKDAKKYETLNYSEVLAQDLAVMDATSIALCMKNQIPILVFNMELLASEKAPSIEELKNSGTWVG